MTVSSIASVSIDIKCLEKLWQFNTQATPFNQGPIKPTALKGDLISIVVSATESSSYSKSNSESVLPSVPDNEKLIPNLKVP